LGTARKSGATKQVANVRGAVTAPLPRTLAPQLATLVKKPPTGDACLYEAKLDGYRILARIESSKVPSSWEGPELFGAMNAQQPGSEIQVIWRNAL